MFFRAGVFSRFDLLIVSIHGTIDLSPKDGGERRRDRLMAVRKSVKGTVTVTKQGAIVANEIVTKAIADISNMRATKRECTKAEDAAKVVVYQAVGDRARMILDLEGNLICEVKEIMTNKVTVDAFVDALETLFPTVWIALMDINPHAVESAKKLANEQDSYLKVLPK
jgi:hypothetical protein